MRKIKQWVFRKIKSSLLTQNYESPFSCVNIGLNSHCTGNYFDGDIVIGERSIVRRSEFHGRVEVGNFTTLSGPNIDFYSGEGIVTIGNFCSIARNVSFQVEAHNHQKLTTYLIFKNVFNEDNDSEVVVPGNINVGNDVWIGSHSIVLGNVNIGNGAVVAANSVVNDDVPPFAIVAGSPARIIKYRFDQETIEKITELGWWNWDLAKLRKKKNLFIHEVVSGGKILREFNGAF
jgi:acetyltransferase-like isoleucine patch superfamily enzyme